MLLQNSKTLSLVSLFLQLVQQWTMMNKICRSLLSTKEILAFKMLLFNKQASTLITICYSHPSWSQCIMTTSLKGVIENYLKMSKLALISKVETMKVSDKCCFHPTILVAMMIKAISKGSSLSKESLMWFQHNSVQRDHICSMKMKICLTAMVWKEYLQTIDDLLVKLLRQWPLIVLSKLIKLH